MITDLEDLENMDASNIYLRRITAKEVLITQEDDEFKFATADGTAKLSGRDYECGAPTPRREQTVRSEDLSGEIQMLKPGETFFGPVVNTEPRVCVPKEETFSIPLKYIDVARSTHTDLDVLQEWRIHEYWNVDANRSSSDS